MTVYQHASIRVRVGISLLCDKVTMLVAMPVFVADWQCLWL